MSDKSPCPVADFGFRHMWPEDVKNAMRAAGFLGVAVGERRLAEFLEASARKGDARSSLIVEWAKKLGVPATVIIPSEDGMVPETRAATTERLLEACLASTQHAGQATELALAMAREEMITARRLAEIFNPPRRAQGRGQGRGLTENVGSDARRAAPLPT